ncbi:MAG: DNA-binding protein [Jatrophihabitantaceae bacterium]
MTLAELLAPFGVGEEEFVEELSRDLHAAPDVSATRLTEADESILRWHGEIIAPGGDANSVRRAVLRASSANLADETRESLTVEQVAKLLQVDGSRVRHRVRDRALYGFKIGGGLRLPTWQFTHHDAIPGLRAVLAALPTDVHPLEVAGLMTTPDPDLVVVGEPVSPRDWLIGGGDVGAVVAVVEDLDRW